MNTRIQKLITFIFLILGVILLFTNCETELNKEIIDTEKAIVVKHISLKKLQKKGNYTKILKSFSKAIKQDSKDNSKKGIFSMDSTFYIHTDFIYETSTDSITNYTFRIERVSLDSLKIENLILSKNNNTNDIQLRIIEFSKDNGIYNSILYNIETNNINLDSLQFKSQEVYIYGTQMFVDDCVTVVYTPCNGTGNDDGHAPTSNCAGSPTTLSYENCHYVAPDGESSGGGGGGTSTTHIPNGNGIGAFTIIDRTDYYGTFLKNNGFNLGTAERNWLESHNLQRLLLKDFIETNKASSYVNNFGAVAVDAWMNGGEVDFEKMQDIVDLNDKSPFNLDISNFFDNISPLPDDDTPEAEKLKCIYTKLTQSPKFKKLFINTFGSSQKINVKFELSDELPDDINGKATPSGTTNASTGEIINMLVTIKINKNTLGNRSSIGLARTIIHECLHAFLDVKLVDCNSGATLDFLSDKDLGELINIYYDNFNCTGGNQSQHEFMFSYLLPTIKEMLLDVKDSVIPSNQQTYAEGIIFTDSSLNINKNWDWNNFCYYFSMDGLQHTNSFINSINNNPSKYFLFNNYKSVGENSFRKQCNE